MAAVVEMWIGDFFFFFFFEEQKKGRLQKKGLTCAVTVSRPKVQLGKPKGITNPKEELRDPKQP